MWLCEGVLPPSPSTSLLPPPPTPSRLLIHTPEVEPFRPGPARPAEEEEVEEKEEEEEERARSELSFVVRDS